MFIIYDKIKPFFESKPSLTRIVIYALVILVVGFIILNYYDNTITLWARDNFLLNFTIVLALLFAVGWVFQNTQNPGGKIVIDYFKIKKLEITMAFAVLYMMFAFLSITIIFTYAAIYESQKVCHPLMYYLGNKRGCRSDPTVNTTGTTSQSPFTNINPNANPNANPNVSADFQTTISRFYSNSLEGFQSVSDFMKTSLNSYEILQDRYLVAQEKTINAFINAMVDPLKARVLPFIYRPIENYLNR